MPRPPSAPRPRRSPGLVALPALVGLAALLGSTACGGGETPPGTTPDLVSLVAPEASRRFGFAYWQDAAHRADEAWSTALSFCALRADLPLPNCHTVLAVAFTRGADEAGARGFETWIAGAQRPSRPYDAQPPQPLVPPAAAAAATVLPPEEP